MGYELLRAPQPHGSGREPACAIDLIFKRALGMQIIGNVQHLSSGIRAVPIGERASVPNQSTYSPSATCTRLLVLAQSKRRLGIRLEPSAHFPMEPQAWNPFPAAVGIHHVNLELAWVRREVEQKKSLKNPSTYLDKPGLTPFTRYADTCTQRSPALCDVAFTRIQYTYSHTCRELEDRLAMEAVDHSQGTAIELVQIPGNPCSKPD